MIPSLIRTYVPIAVAWLVGWLASVGINVDSGTQAALATGIGAVVSAIYYAVIRWAEQRWPVLSVLLGSRQQPGYAPKDTPTT